MRSDLFVVIRTVLFLGFLRIPDAPTDECVELVNTALAHESHADGECTKAQFVWHEHFLDATQRVNPAQHCLSG